MPEKRNLDIFQRLSLIQQEFVEETKIAQIWRVQRPDKTFAALKIYHREHMGSERSGFDVLATAEGKAAVMIFEIGENFALMEWIDGPSLGDLAREGADRRAAEELVDVARHLHANIQMPTGALPRLDDWFDGMFDKPLDHSLSHEQRSAILKCQVMTSHLLSSQVDVQPMHGDLHHDNVKLSERGYVTFDAKGILGDRTYELANAFRNPKGMSRTVYNPDRIHFLANLWSKAFCVDRARLLQWATVKCAWSISLRGGKKIMPDPEFELLHLLLAAMEASSPS